MSADIVSAGALLKRNLEIPNYQRPYKWSTASVQSLLEDIDAAINISKHINDYKYRIGTVILHCGCGDEEAITAIVDGQQRLITLSLLMIYLQIHLQLNAGDIWLAENANLTSTVTYDTVQRNYDFIEGWFAGRSDDYKQQVLDAIENVLEAVVMEVDDLDQAFQLFDSQNTRGKELDPHDLLKAYHLRAMGADTHEMRRVVSKWESFEVNDIRELFSDYLYPISSWIRKEKSKKFSSKDIDEFKGISAESGYTYANRARQAMPYYQIGEPFVEGKSFFEMAEGYLELLEDIDIELASNPAFKGIFELLEKKGVSVGMSYAGKLFRAVLLCYYDRFKNFDERAVKTLFIWAFSLRLDLKNLAFDSINKYAIGESNGSYTNLYPMFSIIFHARLHTEISNLQMKIPPDNDGENDERKDLRMCLRNHGLKGAVDE